MTDLCVSDLLLYKQRRVMRKKKKESRGKKRGGMHQVIEVKIVTRERERQLLFQPRVGLSAASKTLTLLNLSELRPSPCHYVEVHLMTQ